MPALILLQDRSRLAVYLERALFSQGFEVLLLSAGDVLAANLQTALKVARSAGVVLILSAESLEDQEIVSEAVRTHERFEFVFDLAKQDLPQDDAEAVAAVVSLLGPLRRSH
jgi:hypothetical protein